MCLGDILNGKHPQEIQPDVMTFMFVCVTGRSFQEIERMTEKDFKIYAPMVQVKFANDCQGRITS